MSVRVRECILFVHKRERARRLQQLESQLAAIPCALELGCLSLVTAPVRQALHGMALSWKSTFASVVHEHARVRSSRPSFPLFLFPFFNTELLL